MKNNSLKQLAAFGQSIWLDYIRRDLIASGGLRLLIEEDGLRGMTSNPAIFEKAIVDSHDYDEDIRAMTLKGKGAEAIYESLSQRDVRSAADEFRPLYDRTNGKDGYVSLEVKNPSYSDVKYIESLIGPDTVNTVPVETLDAYRDHGDPKARLEQDVERAGWVMERLSELGISINKVTQQLEDEGVEKFNKPFDKLMEILAKTSPRQVREEP